MCQQVFYQSFFKLVQSLIQDHSVLYTDHGLDGILIGLAAVDA